MLHKVILAACLVFFASSAFASGATVAVYEGQYFYNFENAIITPKGGNECWAIKGDLSAAELPGKNGAPPWGTADVVVRGVLSPKGHYGNLGACTHQIAVLEVLKIANRQQR